MDSFDEISQVVPYLEVAHDCGQDLDTPQLYLGTETPVRLFKTHAWAPHCPPFRRCIVVLRNPRDVLVSFHRFFEGWFFEAGTVTLDDFANYFWLARDVPESRMQNASYFVHLVSWFQHAKLPPLRKNCSEREEEQSLGDCSAQQSICFVCFEDLVENLEQQVRRIAKFILSQPDGPPWQEDEDLIRLVTERATFAFMKSHESKFDEHFTKLHRNAACGLPPPVVLATSSASTRSKNGTFAPGGGGSKIRQGGVDAAQNLLSEEVRRRIDQKWKEIVSPVTGCNTYDELRIHLRQLRRGDE
jgi:hypothetical protein